MHTYTVFSLSLSLSLSRTRSLYLSHSLTHTHSLSLSLSLSLSRSLYLSHSLSHSLPPSLLAAGSVLCAVGLERGQVKVFSLTTSLVWSNEFTLSVQLATELHQMSSVSGGWN